jgi:hypothetical protein
MLQEVSSREKFDYVPQDEKNSVSDAAFRRTVYFHIMKVNPVGIGVTLSNTNVVVALIFFK